MSTLLTGGKAGLYAYTVYPATTDRAILVAAAAELKKLPGASQWRAELHTLRAKVGTEPLAFVFLADQTNRIVYAALCIAAQANARLALKGGSKNKGSKSLDE